MTVATTGAIHVTKSRDWLTPYTVEIRPDFGPSACARFAAAAKAQEYALAKAHETGFTLVYADHTVDTEPGPRRISLEEFQARMPKMCKKCREMKPLVDFRVLWHTNQHHAKGQRIPHGYADYCLGCEEAAG